MLDGSSPVVAIVFDVDGTLLTAGRCARRERALGRSPGAAAVLGVMTFLLKRWRHRRARRAWARGELEFAGALGCVTSRRRRAQLLLR